MMTPIGHNAKMHAVQTLNSLLTRASAIKIKDLGPGRTSAGMEVDFLGHIEVLGRRHTLACAVEDTGEPDSLRAALKKLRNCARCFEGDVTPVVVVPFLSPEARALCMENKIGCVDLCGNAYLAVDEVFISTRCIPGEALMRSSSEPARPEKSAGAKGRERVREGFPPRGAELPSPEGPARTGTRS